MRKAARAQPVAIHGAGWERAFAEAAQAAFSEGDPAIARWFATADKAGRDHLRELFYRSLSGELPASSLLSILEGDAPWVYAINAWLAGDETPLTLQLEGAAPIPAFARGFLAAVVSGQATKKRGRKSAAHAKTFKDTVDDLTVAQRVRESYSRHHAVRQAQPRPRGAKGDTPSYQAIDDVAAELKMTRHQVEAIVHPRAKASTQGAGNN